MWKAEKTRECFLWSHQCGPYFVFTPFGSLTNQKALKVTDELSFVLSLVSGDVFVLITSPVSLLGHLPELSELFTVGSSLTEMLP